MKKSPPKSLDGFVQLLRSYTEDRNLDRGRQVHRLIIASPKHRSNTLLANQLITMYTKCRSFREAIDVFNGLEYPDVVSWNSLVAALAKAGQVNQAMKTFREMPRRDLVSWNIAIQVLLDNEKLFQAEMMLLRIPQFNTVAWNSIIIASAEAGEFDRAKHIFHQRVLEKDRLSWNAILIALAGGVRIDEAAEFFNRMPQRDVVCCNAMAAAHGRIDAGQAKNIFDQTVERDAISWNTLLGAYSRFGHIEAAKLTMGKMPLWDAVSCTTVLSAYTQLGHLFDAKNVFDSVPRNLFSWNTMLAAYFQIHAIGFAKSLLVKMPAVDVVTWNTSVVGFAADGHLTAAREVFTLMPCRDATSWGSIVAALAAAGNGSAGELMAIFFKMPMHDVCSWNAVIGSERDDTVLTKMLFDSAMERNVVTWTALIYATCRGLDGIGEADKILERMPGWDVVCLNVMMSAHCQCGNLERAREIFDGLPARSIQSWNAMLQIASCEDERQGNPNCERTREVFFDQIPARDVASWTILLAAMSQRCDLLPEVKKTFNLAPQRSLITWNVMLAAYTSLHHLVEQALEHFQSMPERDVVSYNAVVAAVAGGAQFSKAAFFLERMPQHNAGSWNSLLLGCASHGVLDQTRRIFARMPSKNIVSWNALLDACARNGRGEIVIELLRELCLDGSSMPDEISFTHVLAACTHIGFVETSRKLFVSLWPDFGVAPDEEHFCSMVDVLCRSGQLRFAEELVNSVPSLVRSGSVVWGSLLAGCHTHRDLERASQVATLLDESNPAHYVILSNIFSSC